MASAAELDQLGLAESVREIGFPVLGVNSVDTVTGRTNSFARIEPGHRWSSTHVWLEHYTATAVR